ncbi:MAG: hypothetical protein P4K94_07260 [Terracidiphilus sp.]|nr:hypothetical protein [Terracidiphilus sp.]
MNIVRLTALGTLALTLHLQAQTPAPAPPVAGPTMEQTIAFINDTLRQHGKYTVQYRSEFQPPTGSIVESQTIHSAGKCELEYESVVTDPSQSIFKQQLSLDSEDPRAISVEPNPVTTTAEWFVRLRVEDNQGFYINGVHKHWGVAENDQRMNLARFLNKDLADRVARAYIHALVLCYKPEAPSPF